MASIKEKVDNYLKMKGGAADSFIEQHEPEALLEICRHIRQRYDETKDLNTYHNPFVRIFNHSVEQARHYRNLLVDRGLDPAAVTPEENELKKRWRNTRNAIDELYRPMEKHAEKVQACRAKKKPG